MGQIVWELPLRTVSENNCSEHWSAKSKRHKQQQFIIRALFAREGHKFALPCIVRMVRLSSRLLDDDNLLGAFKWIRDEISECLIPAMRKVYVTPQGKVRELKGRADSDSRIKWEYAQEKSKKLGIRIEIKEKKMFNINSKPPIIQYSEYHKERHLEPKLPPIPYVNLRCNEEMPPSDNELDEIKPKEN